MSGSGHCHGHAHLHQKSRMFKGPSQGQAVRTVSRTMPFLTQAPAQTKIPTKSPIWPAKMGSSVRPAKTAKEELVCSSACCYTAAAGCQLRSNACAAVINVNPTLHFTPSTADQADHSNDSHTSRAVQQIIIDLGNIPLLINTVLAMQW